MLISRKHLSEKITYNHIIVIDILAVVMTESTANLGKDNVDWVRHNEKDIGDVSTFRDADKDNVMRTIFIKDY